QLGERPLALLEPAEAHPREDRVGLRELDVAIVDDLDVVAPGVEEVVVSEHLSARLTCGGEGGFAVVYDETDVARPVGRLGATCRDGDELVAQVDERHRSAVAAPERELEDPAV